MSYKLRFSKSAVRDIENVLTFTLEQFGEQKYIEYKELIGQALEDIEANPNHSFAKHRPELRADARTFHIARHGKRARHFILYRIVDDGNADIGRLLHDAMDIQRHLPPGFD